MLRKDAYFCSYCKDKVFFNEGECREHESKCNQFKKVFNGEAITTHEGYPEYYIGDINIQDLWQRLEGHEIKIEILRRI